MKIAIICSDFQKSNLKKLPWKYVYEIAKYLKKTHEIIVITDSDKKDVNEIKIIPIEKIFVPFKGETEELLSVLTKENPDKCIMLLGLTSFLRKEFKIEKPVIGIFTSPIYSIKELLRNVGIKDTLYYRKYMALHYLNALIPSLLVKKWEIKFEKIIFLSDNTYKKIVQKGLSPDKAIFIPPGIDEDFLVHPTKSGVDKVKSKINPDNLPIVLYFTSPLTLRGTDILVEAFAHVRKKMDCKLIFLSRLDYEELLREEEILRRIAAKNNINNSIEIISEYLSPKQLKEYISIADVICLPFKIVISDIPISLLEAMALEKPVISTNVGGIPEILKGNGILVNPNDPYDLADSLFNLLNKDSLLNEIGIKGREYMENYVNWTQVGNIFVKIIGNNPNGFGDKDV